MADIIQNIGAEAIMAAETAEGATEGVGEKGEKAGGVAGRIN